MTFWARREERVGGMPLQETPLSVRQREDTSWSSRPDHQYPFQYTTSDTEKGEETSEGRAQRPLLQSVPGQDGGSDLSST